MSFIKDLAKACSLAMLLSLLNSQAFAHVVIDRIQSGNNELDKASVAAETEDERAMGELEEYQIKEVSDDWNFNPKSRKANGPGNRSGDRNRGFRLNSPRSNRFGGGGGAGGGGGNRSNRARPRRSEDRREIVQTMVAMNDQPTEPQPETEDAGTDVSIFDSGQGSPATGGSGGLGGGGNFANSGEEDDETGTGNGGTFGGRSTVVSGTPEPAALVIWAFAGTCGFGFLRYTQKKSKA